MTAVQVLATAVALSSGLVLWCWARVVRGVREPAAPWLSKLMSTMSVLALSLSWLVLALLIIAPRALGIGGHEPHFGPFWLGCGAALCGAVLAAGALGAVRKPLGLSSGTLLVLWLIVLDA